MHLDSTALLTPSRITSRQRHEFASASLKSLRRAVGDDVQLYVVHDSPPHPWFLPSPIFELTPACRWDSTAERIYSDSFVRFMRREGKGSASAMRQAVTAALSDKKKYGFIHLDDHVYHEHFGNLFSHGIDALEKNPALMWVRFSGYPVICSGRPKLAAADGQVHFDAVRLTPCRYPDYTLWWSGLDPEIIRGAYWPVAMWFSIYRLDVLAEMLDMALERASLHLAHVELYFKSESGFSRLREAYSRGRFGYINMQNGGIEVHRNANWRDLMQLPNEALR